jgi:hypothetical protein
MHKLGLALAMMALCTTAACGDDDGETVDMTARDLSVTAPDLTGLGGDGGAMNLGASLTKAQESPVCAGAGASATGTASITIAANGTGITVNSFTYSGLSGAASMAHIHFGAAGVDGPVIFDFGSGAQLNSPITNKTFTALDYPSPAPTDAPATFAAFVSAMRAGQSYINLHTSACGAGEIRGQIQ